MNMKSIQLFSIAFFILNLNSLFPQAPFKNHLNLNTKAPVEETCSTSGFYDANTAVTFLGDSRMDLVDNIAYGAASLDHSFATYGAWNEILEFFSPWY
jgi:hypothetical protein